MIQYKNKDAAISAAQELGSSAGTFRGALRFLKKQTRRSVFWESRPFIFDRKKTRARLTQEEHTRRVCSRYVGLKRLPRYLSAADRAAIARHPATGELERLSAIPLCARAYFLPPKSPVRQIARFAGFVAEAEKNKGVLTESGVLRDDAYDRYPWGRLQVRGKGDCLPPQQAGLAESGSNWDWNKKSTLQRQVDYSYIIPPKPRPRIYIGYYVDGSMKGHIVRRSQHYLKIDSEQPIRVPAIAPQSALKIHTQRRLLSLCCPSALQVDYDREAKKLMLVDGFGEQYHLYRIASVSNARKQVREAVTALRKRRAEKIAITNPEKIWVAIEDSYAAGNCRAMTDEFAAQFIAAIGAHGPVCARGDAILAVRDDAYTRRALSYAATRQ